MGKTKREPPVHHPTCSLLSSSLLISTIFFSCAVRPSFAATSADDASAMLSLAKSIAPLPPGWSTDPSPPDPCGTPRWAGVSCDSGGRVTSISLQGKSLTGFLPPDLNKLSSLRSLSLQGNRLSGDLPPFENLGNLQQIYLGENAFTSIPPTFFSGLINLVNVSLDHNPFQNWSIPNDLEQCVNLVSFTAMEASVTGPIPDFFGQMVSLQMLRLSYNKLAGGIPPSFRGSGIRELYLNNQITKLFGTLEVLSSMTQLTVLMLQSNNFTGPIPDLSNCTSLVTLFLRDNALTGPVPSSLSSLPSLTNVTLSNNMLQGPLPDIKFSIWSDNAGSGNSFCTSKPGPCDARVTLLLDVAGGFGYPTVIANSWKGNNPCDNWMFVTCDPKGSITVLNFANQRFGGIISPAIAKITSLKNVILSNNNLGGSIPDYLTSMPMLQNFDVSNNNLTGKVPTFRQNINFNYTGNPLIGNDVTGNGSDNGSQASKENASGGSRSVSTVWIVIIVAIVLAVIGLVVALFLGRRNRHARFRKVQVQSPPSELEVFKTSSLSSLTNIAGTCDFLSQGSSDSRNIHAIEAVSMFMSMQGLQQATSNFSEQNILGKGGFGVVYRGELPNGTVIAVKRMECGEMGKKGMSEFQAEISVLTRVRHRHLVALHGYCVEGNERLLVYEYMPQGTLGQHLFGEAAEKVYPMINWKQRLIVALDVARGLEYLHSLANMSFIHRDLKPSNILLDNDLRAKVSDFGLVKLAPDGKHSVETRLAGTFGYLAPEYASTGRVTTKVDVYAFGVILMELITGRKALDDSLPEDNIHLVSWFRRMLINKNSISKSVDPRLNLENEDLKNVAMVAELAGHCTSREAQQRPNMGYIVNILVPLVDQWKPCCSTEDDNVGIRFSVPLPQRLQQWQQTQDSTMMSSISDSHIGSMDNTQGSITSKPEMIPHGR